MSFESSTTPNGQVFGGGVGTATIREYGFFYGTNSTAVDNAKPGSFVGCSKEVHIAVAAQAASLAQIIRRSEVTGLTPGTKYYYKSYTTTNVCTGYGPRKDATTSSACAEYYSCSADDTYDTDPACPNANLIPTATSIVYFRHDWRLVDGTALTDLNGDIPNQPTIGITPYRMVIQQGGYIYATGSFNAGTQVIINTGGQFGYEGSPLLIVDGLTSTGPKFVRVTMNGGSFVSSASMVNSIKIDGVGEVCNDGAFSNNANAPGSVYGNYNGNGGLITTRYTDAKCIGNFALPVKLISFGAKRVNNGLVTYNWVTASEINNDYFEIEVSTNAFDWTVISNVTGMGNSTILTSYSTNEKTGSVYKYARLVQVDYDGTTSYSKVRNIATGSDGNTHLTPILNGFIVESDTENIVSVFSINSEMVFNGLIQSGFEVIEFNNLSSGVYIVKCNNIVHKIHIN